MGTKGSIQEVKDALEARIRGIFPSFNVAFAENKDGHFNLRIIIEETISAQENNNRFGITIKGHLFYKDVENAFGCGTLLHYINLINTYNSELSNEYLVFDTTEIASYEQDGQSHFNTVLRLGFIYRDSYVANNNQLGKEDIKINIDLEKEKKE